MYVHDHEVIIRRFQDVKTNRGLLARHYSVEHNIDSDKTIDEIIRNDHGHLLDDDEVYVFCFFFFLF